MNCRALAYNFCSDDKYQSLIGKNNYSFYEAIYQINDFVDKLCYTIKNYFCIFINFFKDKHNIFFIIATNAYSIEDTF